jgi:hypothetical protein
MRVQIETAYGSWSGVVLTATPRLLTIRDHDGRTVRIDANGIRRIRRIGGR